MARQEPLSDCGVLGGQGLPCSISLGKGRPQHSALFHSRSCVQLRSGLQKRGWFCFRIHKLHVKSKHSSQLWDSCSNAGLPSTSQGQAASARTESRPLPRAGTVSEALIPKLLGAFLTLQPVHTEPRVQGRVPGLSDQEQVNQIKTRTAHNLFNNAALLNSHFPDTPSQELTG